MPPFVHLHAHSAFSFLDGPSPVESLVLRAAEFGQPALALTDTNSVTGVVSLSRRCKAAGIKPIGGCEVVMEGGFRLTLLMDGPEGWASVCRILSAAALRDIKREGLRVRWSDLEENREGVVCLSGTAGYGELPALLRFGRWNEAEALARRCMNLWGANGFFIEVNRTLTEDCPALSQRLLDLSVALGIPAIATNAARYARKADFPAHEALLRVRLGLKPDEQHGELHLNGENFLKSSKAMSTLFSDTPEAVAALGNAARLAERLRPPLDPMARHLPSYPRNSVQNSAFSHLSALVWCGAERRYKGRFMVEVKTRLIHELETIHERGFCDYFLVCWDICKEARRRNIGYGLRGSAVGSAVAYCLDMSEHDPIAWNVSFERFLSKARAKPPDIDIDFRHDLRDDMMTYCRTAYGEERVANVANYVTYRGRSLLRDFGKVLGFDTPDIERLREVLHHCRGDDLAEQLAAKPELRALGIDAALYADLFALCASCAGLPRHLGTHSSGIVISDVPLCEVAPLQWAAKGVTVIALDKDDVEAEGIGLLKIDQLSLRALTAIDISLSTIEAAGEGFGHAEYAARDREDAETLAMIRAAETVGVFQLESPAQMALQWRLKADKFDDLVASVALIRPGPLLGKTVDPYIHRRHGWEKVTYPIPELEPVLAETYGRILFQDQVLDVVRVVGGYAPDEADVFLKTMTHARSQEEMKRLGLLLRERAVAKGMARKAFNLLWKQIQGFSRYGFCHGHSLAFASHAQGTAYLLRHYPAHFLAAILSVEPCGFWPIATITAEAARRGVTALSPCLNRSEARQWIVEERDGAGTAIRCSLSFVKGVSEEAGEAIRAERTAGGPFADLADAGARLSFLDRDALEQLTLAGALDCLCPSRRQTLWTLPAVHRPPSKQTKPIPGQEALSLPIAPLLPEGVPDFTEREQFAREFQTLGFSPMGHPMRFYRDEATAAGAITCAELQDRTMGESVTLSGLCVRPHRPPTPSGQTFVFLTLEDESGMAQVTVTPDVYEHTGAALFHNAFLLIVGSIEQRGTGKILRAISAEPL